MTARLCTAHDTLDPQTETSYWGVVGRLLVALGALATVGDGACRAESASPFHRVQYNNPGLVVDLGVGLYAWPLPLDYDGDGDIDLVVSCPDVPYNGTYFFENPGGSAKDPIFRPGVRIGPGVDNVQISYVGGDTYVLSPGVRYADFRTHQFEHKLPLPFAEEFHAQEVVPNQQGDIRANQWKYVDFDNDGLLDVVIGVEVWKDYGWDNAYDEQGRWQNGPLHGYVYLVRNIGTAAAAKYASPVQLTADERPIDGYGMPSPNLEDFDNDGDLDLLCGEFIDKFTYFENVGTRAEPRFRGGRFLQQSGKPLQAELCMIVPVAIDWDQDGDMDLVVGQEDGRVMLIEHTGQVVDGMPQFAEPVFFRQEAADLKFGVLVTPVSVDWDDDGDEDLICGNAAGQIGFIENLDGEKAPRWASPQLLAADGETIRIQAGPNGSIQGPCEAKWGYTTLAVADWDHDGLLDVVVNSIWGKVVWYRNVGEKGSPRLAAARPIEVAWEGPVPKPVWNWWDPEGNSLVTQWRTTPVVVDVNRDGLHDLVMLDQEGYLSYFERRRVGNGLVLSPPQRIFTNTEGEQLCLAGVPAGGSGRRKLCLVDWNGDGLLDMFVNSENLNFYEGKSAIEGRHVLEDRGAISTHRLAGHSTSPTTVDWNRDGVRDLLIGAEDGHLYLSEHANP